MGRRSLAGLKKDNLIGFMLLTCQGGGGHGGHVYVCI